MNNEIIKDKEYFDIQDGVLKGFSEQGNFHVKLCGQYCIEIPNSVCRIGYGAFEEHLRLIEVTIPDSISVIDNDAFNGCRDLEKVIIPSSVKRIGDGAFSDCFSLKSVTIPNGVTEIGEDAFNNCISLAKIDISNSVTCIGAFAFERCKSLTEIIIPKSIIKMGEYVFRGCTSLTRIYCESKTKNNDWIVSWNNECGAKVFWKYVPDIDVNKILEDLWNDDDNQDPKEKNNKDVKFNNQIKFGALIDWLNRNKVGANPFNMIPDCPGIYKIFVIDEDREQIEFGAAKTVNGKPFCPTFIKNNGRVVKVTVTNASELQKRFTDLNDNVIYIGKATSLKMRLRQYAQMALGGHSHRGGIDIFAVQDYDKYLHVAWYPLTNGYATEDEWETTEIEKFKREHNGQRPLANRAK